MRMKRLGMIENYIYPNYGVLHTESRENIAHLMEQTSDNDPVKSPVIQDIIMSNRIGSISMELSRRLGITPTEALMRFYESETCANLHDRATGLYLFGDLYVADEYIRETTAKKQ